MSSFRSATRYRGSFRYSSIDGRVIRSGTTHTQRHLSKTCASGIDRAFL